MTSNVKILDWRAISIIAGAPVALLMCLAVAVGPIFIWQQNKYPEGSMGYKANDNPSKPLPK